MLGPVMVKLVPPLDDPPVINGLVNTMQRHATAIEKELADMGLRRWLTIRPAPCRTPAASEPCAGR